MGMIILTYPFLEQLLREPGRSSIYSSRSHLKSPCFLKNIIKMRTNLFLSHVYRGSLNWSQVRELYALGTSPFLSHAFWRASRWVGLSYLTFLPNFFSLLSCVQLWITSQVSQLVKLKLKSAKTTFLVCIFGWSNWIYMLSYEYTVYIYMLLYWIYMLSYEYPVYICFYIGFSIKFVAKIIFRC